MRIGVEQRVAVLAACISAVGLAAVPFAGSLGPAEQIVSSGAGLPSVLPGPLAAAPSAPVTVVVPPTTAPPVTDAVAPVEAPPIDVPDPGAGIGAAAEVLADAPADVVSVAGAGDGLTGGGGGGGGGGPAVVATPVHAPAPSSSPTSDAPASEAVQGAPFELHPERLWVVSIGIDDYPGDGHDLAAARADAYTVVDAMAGLGVPGDHIRTVLDAEATVEGILDAVDWLVANAGPEDTALFFYAGHIRDVGFGTEVLVSSSGNWVADWYLAERFAGLQARDAWFAIAGCFGGGFDELLAPGRILTGAADPGELAYESIGFGRSYMVEFLFHQAVILGRAPEPTVQSAVAWANQRLAADYPEYQLWHEDEAGHSVSLDGARRDEAPPPPPPPPPPPDAPPPQAPDPETCTLLVFCG